MAAAESRHRVIAALGIVQVLAWGSSFYLPAVLAEAMAADTAWSLPRLAAGVSFALLVSAVLAPGVGRLIARHGGRPVLSVGVVLLAVGLVLLGVSRHYAIYLLAWGTIGMGMAAGLYDAAFSALGVIYGRQARSAITILTLWGGFASTVCWPLSGWLVSSIGWRGTCFVYALLHLLVSLPLCRVLPDAATNARTVSETDPTTVSVASGEPTIASPPGTVDVAAAVPPLTDRRYLAIVVAGVVLASLASTWSVHFVVLLAASGHSLGSAIALGALVGPAQVGGRLVEWLGRERHPPTWTLLAATVLVSLGFALLYGGQLTAAALIAFGLGNGLWSIARGTLPLALFGAGVYAVMLGRIAAPILFVSALVPLAASLVIERVGAVTTTGLLAVLSLLPLLAAILLLRWRPHSASASVTA